jgi:hypothetical protein
VVLRLKEDLEFATTATGDPRYLQVPLAVRNDPAFRRLSGRVQAAGPTPIARIEECMRLLSDCEYTRRPGLSPLMDPTLEFVRRKRGYCQHFASAMALLLRASGIPARVAVGFSGGEWNDLTECVVVRRRDAHAWVEVGFERFGWLPFDPVEMARLRPAEARTPAGQPETPKPGPSEQAPAERPAETVRPGELAPAPVPTDAPVPAPTQNQTFDMLWERTRNKTDPESGDPVAAAPAAERKQSRERPATPRDFYTSVASRDVVVILGGTLLVALILGILAIARRRRLARLRAVADPSKPPEAAGLLPPSAAPTRAQARSRRQMVELFMSFLSRVQKSGISRDKAQTAQEFARTVSVCLDQASPELDEATELFEEARYGVTDISSERLERGRAALREAASKIRRLRR